MSCAYASGHLIYIGVFYQAIYIGVFYQAVAISI